MKKGFTLIELLAVLAVIGVIAMISVPVVSTVIKDSRQKSYKNQIILFKDVGRTYMSNKENSKLLPDSGSISIPLQELKDKGLISSKDIRNPNYVKDSNKEDEKCKFFMGYITVTKKNEKYVYDYVESNFCTNYNNSNINNDKDDVASSSEIWDKIANDTTINIDKTEISNIIKSGKITYKNGTENVTNFEIIQPSSSGLMLCLQALEYICHKDNYAYYFGSSCHAQYIKINDKQYSLDDVIKNKMIPIEKLNEKGLGADKEPFDSNNPQHTDLPVCP